MCVLDTHSIVWGALCGTEVTGWRTWGGRVSFLPGTHGICRRAVCCVFYEVWSSVSQHEGRALGPTRLSSVQLETLDRPSLKENWNELSWVLTEASVDVAAAVQMRSNLVGWNRSSHKVKEKAKVHRLYKSKMLSVRWPTCTPVEKAEVSGLNDFVRQSWRVRDSKKEKRRGKKRKVSHHHSVYP